MKTRLLPILALASLGVTSACGDHEATIEDLTSTTSAPTDAVDDEPDSTSAAPEASSANNLDDNASTDQTNDVRTSSEGDVDGAAHENTSSDGESTDIASTDSPADNGNTAGSPSESEPAPPSTATATTTGVNELGIPATYLGDYTLTDDVFGTEVTVTVNGSTRTIHANALPNHATGTFPNSGNPNTITEQSKTWTFPAEPTWTGTATGVRTTGVALNGVKFEPGTAETISCSSGETYRIEALQGLYDLGFDMNNAHVQPNGEYHYHGISPLLVDAFDDSSDLVLLGFAADGHLIVYSKSGAYRSGYTLSTSDRAGTNCTPSLRNTASINLAGTTPDGTYTSDWVHTGGSNTLDECNGTTINGTYVYLVTDSYPFVPRCLFGSFSETGAPPAGGGGAGAMPGTPTMQPPTGGGTSAPTMPPPSTAPTDGNLPATPTGPVDLETVAAELGVDVEALRLALGPPPPDLEAAAAELGINVNDLRQALGPPPG